MKNKKYILELTEKQARLLSWACDTFPRIIEGQGHAYQDMFEQAWEKRCKEATGKSMDDEWDGGWHKMREDAENTVREIKRRFWGLSWCSEYGIHYDDTADILWDIHQVIRHQLWKDRDDEHKSFMTVDASPATQFGDEPLAEIRVKED